MCGDGVINTGEDCDDNNTKSDDGCSSTCKREEISFYCNQTLPQNGSQCGKCA